MGWSCHPGGGVGGGSAVRCVSTKLVEILRVSCLPACLPGNPWQQLLLSHFLRSGARMLFIPVERLCPSCWRAWEIITLFRCISPSVPHCGHVVSERSLINSHLSSFPSLDDTDKPRLRRGFPWQPLPTQELHLRRLCIKHLDGFLFIFTERRAEEGKHAACLCHCRGFLSEPYLWGLCVVVAYCWVPVASAVKRPAIRDNMSLLHPENMRHLSLLLLRLRPSGANARHWCCSFDIWR